MTTPGNGDPEPVDEPTAVDGPEAPVTEEPTVEAPPVEEPDQVEPAETETIDQVEPAEAETISTPPPWLFEPYQTAESRRDLEPPRPGFLVSGSAILLLIGALVAVIAFFVVKGPVRTVAGSPEPGVAFLGPIPASTLTSQPTSSSAPAAPPATVVTPSDDPAPTATQPETTGGLLALLAAHPLSTSSATMANTACALTRFDPADDRQVTFFQEAKACADAAWGTVLTAAGIPAPKVELVVVRGGPASTPCGPVNPADPPTQCRGTVYMTPAYLRDVEDNGRYPGRYFGVFLRTYAAAVQDAAGLTILYATARTQPGASASDLDTRLVQQATCLAGVASGAMAGQGAVDGNITNEIRDRLSTLDAPQDAAGWLDKGFQTRSLAACNSWVG